MRFLKKKCELYMKKVAKILGNKKYFTIFAHLFETH